MIAEWEAWVRLPSMAGWHWWRRAGAEPWDAEMCRVSVLENGEVWMRRIGRPWEVVVPGQARWEFAGPVAMPILGLRVN